MSNTDRVLVGLDLKEINKIIELTCVFKLIHSS